MGIPGLERELWNIRGCVVNVSIEKLVKNYQKNTIVVDGFQFYAQYVYPKFDWVCGAFQGLVKDIHDFVQAFERIGVKLVFFFVDGNLDEGADDCGSESWIKRHSKFIEYSQRVIRALSTPRILNNLKKEREYYYTPLNALSVVLFTLRNTLHCEVHFVDSGDRCDAISSYTRSNDCLALLAQDNYYMFYHGIPRYLSIKNLNLIGMTTVQYCPEALARQKDLEDLLLPCLVRYASNLKPDHKEFLLNRMTELDECTNVSVARNRIKEKLKNEMFEYITIYREGPLRCVLPHRIFYFDLLRYKYGFDYLKVQGPLKKWDLIKLKSQEMSESGDMSSRVKQILMVKKYFNECILENFVDFPPSSAIYQPLRKMMYGVLFHEETSFEGDENIIDEESESDEVELQPGALNVWSKKLHGIHQNEEPDYRGVREWFMTEDGCFAEEEPVNPQQIDPALHPGLLLLWDLNNETPVIRDKKWQLCASCISDNLSWQSLRSLPPSLVLPTIVLHYLYQVVPSKFDKKSWNHLNEWEIEVLLAQCVMLPEIRVSDETLSQITISRINARVTKIMAIFLYGCRTVSLLVETCGYPISRENLCPLQFFDGKLFHSFYDRAEWRRNARGLCNTETLPVFQQLKQIVFS